jgi:hypothetical protein
MEDKQKLVQFAIVFNLLSKGKPMTNYEDFFCLFKFLRFQFVPKSHLFHMASWQMLKHVDHEVRKSFKFCCY